MLVKNVYQAFSLLLQISVNNTLSRRFPFARSTTIINLVRNAKLITTSPTISDRVVSRTQSSMTVRFFLKCPKELSASSVQERISSILANAQQDRILVAFRSVKIWSWIRIRFVRSARKDMFYGRMVRNACCKLKIVKLMKLIILRIAI